MDILVAKSRGKFTNWCFNSTVGDNAYNAKFRDARKDDGTYVLCHGDFHDKNRMFKHDPNSKKLFIRCNNVIGLSAVLCRSTGQRSYLLLFHDAGLRAAWRPSVMVVFLIHTFQENTVENWICRPIPSLLQLHEQRWQHRYFGKLITIRYIAYTLIVLDHFLCLFNKCSFYQHFYIYHLSLFIRRAFSPYDIFTDMDNHSPWWAWLRRSIYNKCCL